MTKLEEPAQTSGGIGSPPRHFEPEAKRIVCNARTAVVYRPHKKTCESAMRWVEAATYPARPTPQDQGFAPRTSPQFAVNASALPA
jgi:hypothetical protein